jgi:hypothetical protein
MRPWRTKHLSEIVFHQKSAKCSNTISDYLALPLHVLDILGFKKPVLERSHSDRNSSHFLGPPDHKLDYDSSVRPTNNLISWKIPRIEYDTWKYPTLQKSHRTNALIKMSVN